LMRLKSQQEVRSLHFRRRSAVKAWRACHIPKVSAAVVTNEDPRKSMGRTDRQRIGSVGSETVVASCLSDAQP
jgi:hypothetical protein